MQHNYEHVSSPNIAVTGMGKSLSCFRKRERKSLHVRELCLLSCLLFNQEYKKVMLVFKKYQSRKSCIELYTYV